MSKQTRRRWALAGAFIGCGFLSAVADDRPKAQIPPGTSGATTGKLERIVFVGDSITCGVGVANREKDRYAAVATRLMREQFPGATEINLGRSGNALCQQPEDYAEGILAQNPDAVVIQWGVNDQYWGFSVAQFAASYERLVRTLRKPATAMPIVLTTLAADYRWPENRDLWIGEANVAIQEIAARYHCRVAYVHRALNHEKALQPDGIHPNNAGAEAMAKAIAAAFVSPSLSGTNLAVQFDQGTEVRFMQYVFIPKREGTSPQWTYVAGISSIGMRIETPVPVAIRTAPIYISETAYRVVFHDQAGTEIESLRLTADWSRMLRYTVTPHDRGGVLTVAIAPEQVAVGAPVTMVKIPAGEQARVEGKAISIAAFSLAATELTRDEWNSVRAWALKNGYEFGPGRGETPAHPVSTITWYDAVKFCNAASELAGITPVYYNSAKQDVVYRKGELDLADDCIKADAQGYRLPTEWEWEYACRAGTTTTYYWGDHSKPNPENPHAWHTVAGAKGAEVSPHPVGLKKPNTFGLYDMSGNVAEWCWDRYWPNAPWRVQRGGSVALDNDVTSGFRSPVPPAYRVYDVGLRLASSVAVCPSLRDVIVSKGLTAPVTQEPVSPAYDGRDAAAVAAKLCGLLNPDTPGLKKMRALQIAGKPQEALDAYRDLLAASLRQAPPMKSRPPKASQGAEKIAAWFAETETFATSAKTTFDNLDNAGRAKPNSYHVPTTWDFGMGFCVYGEAWFEILRQIVAALPPETKTYETIPSRAAANMVIFTATDDIAKPLKDPRNCVGNQQIHVAKSLVHLARLLPELRDAPSWEALGIDRLKTGAIARFILPDGGDLEQSFNYNGGLFDTTLSIAQLFEGKAAPAWFKQLRQSAINRKRMFNVLRLASGTMPSVGNNSYGRDMADTSEQGDPFHDPLVRQILDRLVYNGAQALPAPVFTSIALPYSGYYLMRNGWAADSSSLFLKSSRPGAGHNHPDNNGIEICAYGRHLLVDRESPPYNVDHLPEAQRKDVLWVWEYKGEDARWTANTILIDGCGQVPGTDNRGYATTIPNQPWFTSPAFDFVQGGWSRTFKSDEPMNADEVREHAVKYGATAEEIAAQLAAVKEINAEPRQEFAGTHTRQVIYLRDANAWIVTDWAGREDGQPAKEVTQLWHFPSPRLGKSRGYGKQFGGFSPLHPGFEKDHVQCDEAAQRVLTANTNNVNLAILHAVPGGVKYTRYFGDKYPYRGWANVGPSMVSGYVPAVDLYATFPAGAPLVTFFVPIPQGQRYEQRVAAFTKEFADGRIRIKLRFTDGAEVEYLAATKSAGLVAGQAIANAEALLTMTRRGRTEGLAISRAGDSFAFTITDGKLQRTAAITVPSGFAWRETPAGQAPFYE